MSKQYSRILVCGGRDYDSWIFFNERINHARKRWFSSDFCIIEGGATGADSMAKRWAETNGLPLIEMPSHWSRLGDRAGMVRNRWMLQWCNPDLCIAFPGGPGTSDMTTVAHNAGVHIWQPAISKQPFHGTY